MHPAEQAEDLVTVAALRADIAAMLEKGGCCPVCDQTVKQYHRTINGSMGRALVSAARRFGVNPFKPIDELPQHGNTDFAKLRFWGLIAPVAEHDGYWTLTAKGISFARGECSVTRYAVVYNNRLMANGGKQVTIHDCVERFDFDKLWSAGGNDDAIRQSTNLG